MPKSRKKNAPGDRIAKEQWDERCLAERFPYLFYLRNRILKDPSVHWQLRAAAYELQSFIAEFEGDPGEAMIASATAYAIAMASRGPDTRSLNELDATPARPSAVKPVVAQAQDFRATCLHETFALWLWRDDALETRPCDERLQRAAALELDELLNRRAA
jgi:hypothetical protein